MTAGEYFDGLRDRVLEIAKREQTLEQLRVATQPHGQQLGSIGHSGNKDSTAAIDRVILAAEDLDRLRAEVNAELERATQVLYGIDNRGGLAKAKGMRYADTICMRYLQGEDWASIAEQLGCTARWCMELSQAGLRYLDEHGMAKVRDC